MNISAVILAAGMGTRMKSALPKVLHNLAGKPLVWHAIQAARQASGQVPVVVIGHGGEAVRQAVGEAGLFAIQEQQLGTGHAVLQAQDTVQEKTGLVLVTSGDMPLLTPESLTALITAQQENPGPISLLTVFAQDPRGFGRILRNEAGDVQAIVEEAEATPEQLTIHELNVGAYCFSAEWLWPALQRIPVSRTGEYFLTDLVEIAAAQELAVKALVLEDPAEAIGINTRVHLAEAEALLRARINRRWMLDGVSIIDPQSTYIEPGVRIGQDTVVWPNTYLGGDTVIGKECTLGPNTWIRDSQVGDQCQIFASVVERAQLENHVDVGPFSRLRKGTHLADHVHMGNFGETKNSYLGPGTKMGHFSYIGDATIGENVNIGAGTITANYDGENKNPTVIGANAFIGSDTMLIAPLKIGEGARTGAGSVVTKDVPPGTVVVGMPARAIQKIKPKDKTK